MVNRWNKYKVNFFNKQVKRLRKIFKKYNKAFWACNLLIGNGFIFLFLTFANSHKASGFSVLWD